MTDEDVTDCGGDGCDECDVCKRLNFLEWAGQVSAGVPSAVEKNDRVDRYIKEHYFNDG